MTTVLALGHVGSPMTRVLTHVRRAGPLTREELVRRAGLSPSSVARAVSALVEGGVLRERADLLRDRARGRPSVPVDIDTRHFVTLGCHVGRRTTTVSIGDLRGGVLARHAFATPDSAPATLAATVTAKLTLLLARFPHTVAVTLGVVAAWADVSQDRESLIASLGEAVGLPVESSELIPALAAAEYLARPQDLPGSTLYLYSRDTVGFVIAQQRATGTEIGPVQRLSHVPLGGAAPCRCGRSGCLEGEVSDEAVAAAAVAAGIVERPDIDAVVRSALAGHAVAHRLLSARARTLGEVAAIVTDMVHPDRVVLYGQGLTAYAPGLDVTRAGFLSGIATAGPVDVSFTRLAGDVQAVAAGAVALRQVYDDPASVMAETDLARCSGD